MQKLPKNETTLAYGDRDNRYMVWYLCDTCHNRTDIGWEGLKPLDKPDRYYGQPCHGCHPKYHETEA